MNREDDPRQNGRFKERPHWPSAELDQKCEQAITAFLRERYGFARIPLPTEALTEIIERDAKELDLEPNLSDENYEVFGYAEFIRQQSARRHRARELWERRYRNNRPRTTLWHEYGHYADFLIMPRFSHKQARVMGRELRGRHNQSPSRKASNSSFGL